MLYEVAVEAQVTGDLETDAALLLEQLEAVGLEDPAIGADEARRMVRVAVQVDALDGRDAHDAGLELWDAAWVGAFGDARPGRFAVTCVPAAQQAPRAPVDELDDAELFADVDAELAA